MFASSSVFCKEYDVAYFFLKFALISVDARDEGILHTGFCVAVTGSVFAVLSLLVSWPEHMGLEYGYHLPLTLHSAALMVVENMNNNAINKYFIEILLLVSLCNLTSGSRADLEPRSGGKLVAVQPIVRCFQA